MKSVRKYAGLKGKMSLFSTQNNKNILWVSHAQIAADWPVK